jgi:hypothetical protein
MFLTGLQQMGLTFENVDPAMENLVDWVSQSAERFPFASGSTRFRQAVTPNFQGLRPMVILFHIIDDDSLQFDAIMFRS